MWRKNLSRYVQAADEPAGADCPRGRPRGVRKRSGWNMKETGGCALCCFFLRRRRSINNMQIRRASATPYVDPLQHTIHRQYYTLIALMPMPRSRLRAYAGHYRTIPAIYSLLQVVCCGGGYPAILPQTGINIIGRVGGAQLPAVGGWGVLPPNPSSLHSNVAP